MDNRKWSIQSQNDPSMSLSGVTVVLVGSQLLPWLRIESMTGQVAMCVLCDPRTDIGEGSVSRSRYKTGRPGHGRHTQSHHEPVYHRLWSPAGLCAGGSLSGGRTVGRPAAPHRAVPISTRHEPRQSHPARRRSAGSQVDASEPR